nr:membrane dipeptidase [Paracoccus denitrificans]
MIAPRRLPALAQRLVDRGYGAAALAKIMGGNLERIARQVWKTG